MSKNPEQKIQKALIVYLEMHYPKLLRCVSPGAGFRMSPGLGMKMKSMGYQKGTPDITILEPCNGYHGLLIELKAPNGRLSPEQREYLGHATKKGYKAVVCWAYDAAVEVIKNYLTNVFEQ